MRASLRRPTDRLHRFPGASTLLIAVAAATLTACSDGSDETGDSGTYPSSVEEVAVAFAESGSCEEVERYLATRADSDRADFEPCDDDEYGGPGSVGGNIITYAHNDECTAVEIEHDDDPDEPSAKVTLSCARGDIEDDSHGVYLVEIDGRWKVVSVNS